MGYFWFRATLAGLRDIEPYEVLQVLGGKVRWPLPALSPDGIRVLMILGRSTAGRPLVVGVRPVLGRTTDWWIVGAREMSATELAEFEEWEADHG